MPIRETKASRTEQLVTLCFLLGVVLVHDLPCDTPIHAV